MSMYAINAVTLAPSEYDLAVLGLAVHDDELILLQSLQLGILDSSVAETGLTGTIETGMLSLGADEKKYITGFKTTLSGDSTTNVQTTIELDGDTLDLGSYELVGRSGPASFVRPWRLGGGVKADSVSLKFEATAGTAWKLSGLTVNTELL